jgi:plastocyanin
MIPAGAALSPHQPFEEVPMNLRRALSPMVVGLVAVVALAGCGKISNSYGGAESGSASPAASPAAGAAVAPAAGNAVAIQNFAFAPQTLTVKVGTKVTWTNNDSAPHTVTSTDGPSTSASTTGLFDSGQMASGDAFSFTFTEAGTYYYVCTLHATMASMHAKVVVE